MIQENINRFATIRAIDRAVFKFSIPDHVSVKLFASAYLCRLSTRADTS